MVCSTSPIVCSSSDANAAVVGRLRTLPGDGVGLPERRAVLDEDRDAGVGVERSEELDLVRREGIGADEFDGRLHVARHRHREPWVRVAGVVELHGAFRRAAGTWLNCAQPRGRRASAALADEYPWPRASVNRGEPLTLLRRRPRRCPARSTPRAPPASSEALGGVFRHAALERKPGRAATTPRTWVTRAGSGVLQTAPSGRPLGTATAR
jgi:hypothetical protein